MTSTDTSSPPERPADVLGAPAAGPDLSAARGPQGVWPPPRPTVRMRDDPATEPLLPPATPDSGTWAEGGRGAALLHRLVPATWRGARVDPGRPGATALAVVAAGAAVVAAVGVWVERPRAEPVDALPAVTVAAEANPTPPAAGGGTAGPAGSATTSESPAPPETPLVVSVSGEVARPGLVEVPPGSRVADVLDAAGGALPGTDLSRINLARRVVDGEQVAVGVPPAPDAAPPGPDETAPGGASAAGPAGPVDLNAATGEQLEALPGVGPVTARRILEWRARNGRFARVEQLREIEGIGERRFAQLRELVTV